MKRGNENAQLRSEEVERLNEEESADAGVFGAFTPLSYSRRPFNSHNLYLLL